MNARTDSRPGADWAQDRLRRFGARLAPGAGGFLSWWGRNLAAWLPARVRRVLGFDRGRLLLQIEGDALLLRLQQGDELRDLGAVPGLLAGADGIAMPADPLARLLSPRLAQLPRWLLVPAASGLRRRLALPAAAAERLRDVVGFEIDRQTPFAADSVAFDARVLRRAETADGQIEAELVVVPRQRLEPLLEALGPLASGLSGIDAADPQGVPLGINLLTPSQRRRAGDPLRAWNLLLAAIAVFALAAAMWQLLANRRTAAQTLEQTISRNAQAARQAAAQRQELIDLIEGQAFLDRLRVERPTTVQVMDELSRRLPDTTYLEKLAIEDNSLLLIGLSREAPSLVQRLQGSPLWRAPALTGALQPDPGSGRDRFTLTAELGPPKPAAASPAPRTEADDGQ